MRLGPIVLKIRTAETEMFGNRVAGAAELRLAEKRTIKAQAAFVVQISEAATPNRADSGIVQEVDETFSVIVVIDNRGDDEGLIAYDMLHEARQQIHSAILGWTPPGAESVISYAGGQLVNLTRTYLWYRFDYVVTTFLDDDDGVQPGQLDDFETIYAQYILYDRHTSGALDAESFSKGFNITDDSQDWPINTQLALDPTKYRIDMTQIIDLTKEETE